MIFIYQLDTLEILNTMPGIVCTNDVLVMAGLHEGVRDELDLVSTVHPDDLPLLPGMLQPRLLWVRPSMAVGQEEKNHEEVAHAKELSWTDGFGEGCA